MMIHLIDHGFFILGLTRVGITLPTPVRFNQLTLQDIHYGDSSN